MLAFTSGMVMTASPSIVILAAGPSRRFGAAGQKLTQTLGTRSVLGHTIHQAMATGWPLCVVLTPALVPLASPWVATRDLVVLDVDEAARGLGHSIAAGVVAHGPAPGWVTLPGDMPLVQAASIIAVGRALAEHPVAYAQHQGRAGYPQAFGAELFSELVALEGEAGARRLMARYPAAAVDLDDPGVLLDVDTEADLAALRAAMAQEGSSAAH